MAAVSGNSGVPTKQGMVDDKKIKKPQVLEEGIWGFLELDIQ